MDFPPRLLLFGHRAWRLALQAACLLLMAMPLPAQTVRPVIDENIVQGPGKKAKGKIEYVNDSLQPLTVTLDTQSFTVSDTGDLSYRPLDNSIHVKFSATSFRIPPRQNYLVFYEASADAVPSWFVVYATFAGYKERTTEGLKIQLLLPHTIYLLPKQEVKKDELVIKAAEYDPGSKIVRVRVENTGPVFCRVLEADVSSKQDKATNNGFPVFPHSQRQVEIPWPAKGGPSKLTLQFQHFQLQQPIGSTMP
jgi:P pilus assembly chaperone PapD